MNVTLRPNGPPDVYINEPGRACNLPDLDKQIRALLTARRWLKAEIEQNKVLLAEIKKK